MRDLVKFENVIVAERFSAYFAVVRFLPCVGSDVNLKLLGACESLVAGGADVWFFSCMCSHVDDKLTALDECL